VPALSPFYSTFEVVESVGDIALDRGDTRLLVRVVRSQLPESLDPGMDFIDGGLARFEIRFLSREELVALPGLGVIHRVHDALEFGDNLV